MAITTGWDASRIQTVDFFLEVSKGNVADHSFVPLFSQHKLSASAGELTMWPLAADPDQQDYVFPTVSGPLNIVSTSVNDAAAGTGIQSVRILGLDASFNQIEEDVTMNGTTVVVTTKSFFRVNQFFGTAGGSVGSAVGQICALTTLEPVTQVEVSIIPIGASTDRQIVFTVPADHRLYFQSLAYGFTEKKAGFAAYRPVLKNNVTGLTSSARILLVDNETNQTTESMDLSLGIPEKVDVVIKATTDLVDVPITMQLSAILVKDKL